MSFRRFDTHQSCAIAPVPSSPTNLDGTQPTFVATRVATPLHHLINDDNILLTKYVSVVLGFYVNQESFAFGLYLTFCGLALNNLSEVLQFTKQFTRRQARRRLLDAITTQDIARWEYPSHCCWSPRSCV